jgi:hypothetical protein
MGNSTQVTSCPSGGTFWLCPNTTSNFIGCCNSDGPCDSGCPASQLQAASVNASLVGQVPDQQCPSGAQFYQCSGTSPPFWGCCKSNPCQQNGCPAKDLAPAIINSQQALWQAYAPPNTTAPTPTNTPKAAAKTVGPNVGIIVGAVVGGVAVILLLFAFIFLWARRRRDVRHVPLLAPSSQGDWDARESKPTTYMGYGKFQPLHHLDFRRFNNSQHQRLYLTKALEHHGVPKSSTNPSQPNPTPTPPPAPRPSSARVPGHPPATRPT